MPPTVAPAPTEAPTARLDALPRLSPRSRESTIAGGAPEPGRYLQVEDGAEQRLLRLGPGITHVGRGWAAQIRLDDHAVSRRHAILVNRPDALRILDDRSANGTYVNGRRVSEATLADGDVILIGAVVLSYREFA
jgi:pSer/pThr/pTyr-binding forkhead associated (FHA) protein